jgi:N-succinyldiaminopimelate aminotransferase
MPRHPDFAPSVAHIAGSVYSALAHRLAGFAGETYPLHVGDTWMEPPAGCRMEDLTVAEHPGMHRYTTPHGLPELVAAIAGRVTERSGVETSGDDVLLTTGATGGLGAVLGALVAPGDEVLILAPYWPLIAGIVRSFHAAAVAVPWFGEVDSIDDGLATLERHASERTVALYLNTPNNPSGRVMPPEQVAAVVGWAAERGLWVISDEVYEDYVFDPASTGEHAYARPHAPERTFAAHSFSKAYGMAGNRVGYVVGPAAAMQQVRKVSTHSFYSAPTASQLAALGCLGPAGDGWIAEAKASYRRTGTAAADRLGVAPPEGATFFFLDVAEQLDDRGLGGFLEDCVDRGLFLAPGPSFGPYPTHVRLCFTAVEA